MSVVPMSTSPPSSSDVRPVSKTLDTNDSIFFKQQPLVIEPATDIKSPGFATGRPLTRPNKVLRKRDVATFWLVLLFFLVLGIGISYGILGPHVHYSAGNFMKNLPQGYSSGIYLQGVVEILDIPSRQLTVEWIVHRCEETGPYQGCNALTDATNFYLNENATLSSTFDEDSAAGVFKANLTSYITDGFCLDKTQCWQDQVNKHVPYEQTMVTQHRFSIRPAVWSWKSTAQAYPFDTYEVYATFLALDPATNASRPIIGASMTGTVPNFVVVIQDRKVTSPNSSLEWRMVSMDVHRAGIVIGFAFLVWLINWLMTGVVLWITISAVQGRRKIPADLFAIPITALFALPTVRQAMPGGPSFGCILDYSGIILNLAILAICSVALLLSVIARDAREVYSPLPSSKLLPGFRRQSTLLGKIKRRLSTGVFGSDDEENGMGLDFGSKAKQG